MDYLEPRDHREIPVGLLWQRTRYARSVSETPHTVPWGVGQNWAFQAEKGMR